MEELTHAHFCSKWKSYCHNIAPVYGGVRDVPFYRKHKTRAKQAPLFQDYQYVFSRYLKNRRVIDIGCGTGFFSALMAHSADYVLGIDINNIFLEHARYFSELLGLSNTDFEFVSAHDINQHYLEANNIDSVFIHAAGGKGWGRGQADILLEKGYQSGIELWICDKSPLKTTIKEMEEQFKPHPILRDRFKVIEVSKCLCINKRK